MLTRRVTKLLLICITLIAVGCSKNTEVLNSQSLPKEYSKLINEADQLNLALEQGRILSLSSERDRRGFKTSLKEARYSLLLLARNPVDKLGIQLGHRALKEKERFIFGRGDINLIDQFYVKLGEVVQKSAKLAGVNLGNLDWRLFGYRFSSGLSPFGSFSTANNWQTGVSLDESYISVRGPENNSWLLSPSFDLTGISNPSFQITHQTRVDQNDRNGDAFSRALINKKAFKAYVSTNYSDGDPNQADWVEVDLGEMPSSIDFHSVNSAKVDLSDFVSTQTTVALVLEAAPTVIGSHYLTWSVSNFEIFGRGSLDVQPRFASLHLHEFNQSVLEPFQQVLMAENLGPWEAFGFGGSFKFAKIEGNATQGDNWLLSPKYPLRNIDNLTLTIKETVRNPNFEKMDILISMDYNGGNPEDSNWVRLDRGELDPIAPGEWVDLSVGPIDLKSYIGQEIVVAFRYQSGPDNTGVWEVGSLNFLGLGDSIRPQKYDITFTPPGGTGETQSFEIIQKFDFNEGKQGLTQQVVSGNPASFELSSRGGTQYFLISGHDDKNVGRTRLISPQVQLGDDPHVKIKHAINFYPSEHQDKKLINIFVRQAGEEIPLQFIQYPSGESWDVVESEALELPQDLRNTMVDFIFEYASIEKVYPNWNIHKFNVLNKKPEEKQ
jgi:hypothetical protein